MMLQLDPRIPLLWRDTESCQLGTGSNPIRFDQITRFEQRVIGLLTLGTTQHALNIVLAEEHATPPMLAELLGTLRTLLMQTPRRLSPDDLNLVSPRHPGHGTHPYPCEQTRARRKLSTVSVMGLAATGTLLASSLAASGVGGLALWDESPVLVQDVGLPGLTPTTIGTPRHTAVGNWIGRCFPADVSLALATADTTLAVIIADRATHPHDYQHLLANDVPHMQVVFDADWVELGPVIVPGKTPCITCRHLVDVDHDPAWRNLRPQLLRPGDGMQDHARALSTSSRVLTRVLAEIDIGAFEETAPGRPHPPPRQSTTVHTNGSIMTTEWQFHPDCGCKSLPAAAQSDAAKH